LSPQPNLAINGVAQRRGYPASIAERLPAPYPSLRAIAAQRTALLRLRNQGEIGDDVDPCSRSNSQKSAYALHNLLQPTHVFVRGGDLPPLLRVQLDADQTDEFHAVGLKYLLNGGERFAIRPGYLSLTFNPFDSKNWDGCFDRKRVRCPS
jgi:hypothetical protein